MNLTGAGKIALILLIAGALGAGYYYFGPNPHPVFNEKTINTTAPEGGPAGETTSTTASNDNTAGSESSSEATASEAGPFSYTAPEPVDGKLKGVVELGATGFNSFVVNIDKDKNWKLEKAEFGNSMVIENMATDYDIRVGLKKYIGNMLDYGVSGKDVHFVVSSGAQKAPITQKIIKVLKDMGYMVNTVTPEQEGTLGLKCALPPSYTNKGFFVDIGSGNTKIAWTASGEVKSLETYGAKYYEAGTNADAVYEEAGAKAKQIPTSKREICFIIGGTPFDLAKEHRNGKERYTVLKAPEAYKMEKAKTKAGGNIYKAIADATGCKQFVFDWDANFTIGFLLGLK
ncbi:hypothetical protein [Runella slithyformis]|uniref:Ppx/GppA phosphatase domain-containing protein n=1 Tax=Runella slithyformis (strain ATCC 29530 / DSM 19594 / LMG 11500 / NCIMB 11436 / LSU 4) TaxID=761193 RepID=A0A7U4E467_RUNSL|nr:hypothetical protein Runsl_0690 [Runella slithyformis DSM 19594]